MAFDKPTRNRLAAFVSQARGVITEEFTRQFQSLYGISAKGEITPLAQLGHLDDAGLATATLLRERIEYLVRTHPDDRDAEQTAVDRLAREQAFTVLNRLAAIRMAEKRGFIVESVGKGYQSKGFKVFEQVAGSGLGETYHRYRRYLSCLFDELAVDLGLLFDRRSPQGLLFPQESALQDLLMLLNAPDLDALWAEDETIGWIYQYYNDPAERKKMRDESSAPRNSRELAVRNQFFTPRYVVEFLTDNTLGRIWYEMTQGQTRLKDQCRYLVRRPTEIFLKPDEAAPETPPQEGLSQEELLKQPAYIPHRALKDPREIRMLDPACGSMHFGLYAFDLYEVIYEGAWDLGLESLRRDFPDKGALLREAPRLIIEHNIHGIDIDPRAVQIAGLSIWLRAQKSWQAQRVPAAQRPRILRSNIVCAEPMPGSPELLREFTATLYPPLLGQLAGKVFAHMQLAGEAGSLLKIEEEIATLVQEAKEAWYARPKTEQLKMGFLADTEPKQVALSLDLSGITDDQFWETAEDRIYAALRAYAEGAASGGYQRRLFADDAARGFAFIDVCRKRYSVALMNPPYGDHAEAFRPLLPRNYPYSPQDIYSCFYQRLIFLLESKGCLGALTSRTFLMFSSFAALRLVVLNSTKIHCLADLGFDVLDGARVEVCAIVLDRTKRNQDSLFFRLSGHVDKAPALLEGTRGQCEQMFQLDQEVFSQIPGSPVSYWAGGELRSVFSSLPPFEAVGATPTLGLVTADNDRFVRLRWEVCRPNDNTQWPDYCKGGEYSKFYDDPHLVVDWRTDGEHIAQTLGNAVRLREPHNYFREGISYPLVTNLGLNARVMPKGCIFDNAAPAILYQDSSQLWLHLGLVNSRVFEYFVRLLTTSRHWQVGYLRTVPIPRFGDKDRNTIETLTQECFSIRREWDTHNETSHCFIRPFVPTGVPSIVSGLAHSLSLWEQRAERVHSHAVEIDQVVIDSYGLGKTFLGILDDEMIYNAVSLWRRAVIPEPGRDLPDIDTLLTLSPSTRASAAKIKVARSALLLKERFDYAPFVVELFSFALGCSLGRWDIRFATGERQLPELPDPFASLPVCPPGMLQNGDGLPAVPKDVPADYPLRISWLGILVDDENHPEDIVARVREALEVIWKDRAEAIEAEACEILGVKTLCDYFRRPSAFFADHLKRYSKSRRQAPIYWPLSTAKGSYTLWIYYHRLTDQTLHTALADLVDPKLRAVRAEISALRESATHRNRLEELLDLEGELQDFRAEIERIIKLPWKPNLNDGVHITAGPLWKLFRLPKWQKDLRARWEKLEGGDYDWAHLAYTIWPKRVEEVCKRDRSIAIAHGLEHLCQVEAPKPKGKRGRKKATEPVGEVEE